MNRLLTMIVALALPLAATLPASGQDKSITVFAAASMTDALNAAAKKYQDQSGTKVVLSFASSSTLARQIEQGAPADAFVSANVKWMDYLADKDAIAKDTRRVIAGNDLVIAAPKKLAEISDPKVFLSRGKFAMGDPRHVPAGIYAKQSLDSLGIWKNVQENAVYGDNVRVALEYAIRGETSAAIVYGSDLYAAPELKPVYTFPDDSHPQIRYPAAVTKNGDKASAKFLDYLSSEAGQDVLASFGFAKATK